MGDKGTKARTRKGASSQDKWILVDPARVRFQHSKIRPLFSGCGRSVTATLDSIRSGQLQVSALPPIQVIVGPDANDGNGPWYFSLNNRRLWVLKRCREEGLLLQLNNLVKVRMRSPKSIAESQRYTIENCALEATFIRENITAAREGHENVNVDN